MSLHLLPLVTLISAMIALGKQENITAAQSDELVTKMNRVRAQVKFCTTTTEYHVVGPMYRLAWNEDLVAIAETLAKQCVAADALNTSTLKAPAPFTAFKSAVTAVDDFAGLFSAIETTKANFPATGLCSTPGTCEPFRLMIWANATQVGCAYHGCTGGGGGKAFHAVCTYLSVDNFEGDKPFVVGNATNCGQLPTYPIKGTSNAVGSSCAALWAYLVLLGIGSALH